MTVMTVKAMRETRLAFTQWANDREALSARERGEGGARSPHPDEWATSDDDGAQLVYDLATIMGWWNPQRGTADPQFVCAVAVMEQMQAEADGDEGRALPPHVRQERARRRALIKRVARRIIHG